MHSYSVKLVINRQRVKKVKPCSLYLRVVINRKPIPINLGIAWPLAYIDQENGRILPRSKKDQDFKDYEMMILTELSKINEVFKIYRLQDRLLTPELFKKELKNAGRRKDFLKFMETDIAERYNTGEIVLRTKLNHTSTYKRLVKFAGEIPFYAIDSKFLMRFVHWLKTKCDNDIDTAWCRIRDIKTYLKRAAEEGISINEDYRKFKNIEGGARIVYLENEQIKALLKLKSDPRLTDVHYQTLMAFMFSCFTSLRVSDVQRANWGWVNVKDEMVFLPWKTRKFGRSVTVPLNPLAKSFIQKQKGAFFNLPTDQEMNRSLKNLAVWSKINIHLTFHVARHTFATHYYRETKDIMSLKEILGHRNMKHTMIYAHINDQDKRNGMQLFYDNMVDLLK